MYWTTEIIIGLLIILASLAIVSPRVPIPFPIVLVLSGILLGYIPGLSGIMLNPDLVFLFFLPPLLYRAAAFTSWPEFRANLRPIVSLAVGLVLVTTFAVAAVAHTIIQGLPWSAALVLGAIVSPPDAVATTTILKRLGVPRRLVTILQGESLVNDATGLVLYRLAIVATVAGTFSLSEAALSFPVVGLGGVLIGLTIGWIVVQVRHRVENPSAEITLSLLTPFAAYLPAEGLGLSGVLAVVAAGLYVGRHLPRIASTPSRLQAYAVWDTVDFLLNGLVFLLIGLQLPVILAGARISQPLPEMLWHAALISGVAIVVRLLWVFPAAHIPRVLSRNLRHRDPVPPWQQLLVAGWSGMRGVVSLAAALALPLTIGSGAPFPQRDVIVFLSFCVILATLVLQGLSLPALIRWLRVADDGAANDREAEARLQAAHAALTHLETLNTDINLPDDLFERLRAPYIDRIHHISVRQGKPHDATWAQLQADYGYLQREALQAERATILELWDQGKINDEVQRRIQRDLDLEESRMMSSKDTKQLLAIGSSPRRASGTATTSGNTPSLRPSRNDEQ
jgi:CPA1 family monovalent cation:H+ antiporter